VYGPYEVMELLGHGAIGSIHRALRRRTAGGHRLVALKRLAPRLDADADLVTALVRELKNAALLDHPNIARIHELGRIEGRTFWAREYLPGSDLAALLLASSRMGEPAPRGVAIALLRDLCAALDHAHRAADDEGGAALGLLHRDLSPANLMVTDDGRLVVLDFCVAKATSRRLRVDTGSSQTTLGYESPEAARGLALDPRSDIFAAGVIAHELLTARPLFAARSGAATRDNVIAGEVAPPSRFDPGCPPELDDVVLRALARDPARRFQSAADFAAALGAVAASHRLDATADAVAAWKAERLTTGDSDGDDQELARDGDRELAELAWGAGGELALEVRPGDGDVPHPFEDGEILSADAIMQRVRARPPEEPPAEDTRLWITTSCVSEDEFILVFSHLYESDSLVLFTGEIREPGTRADVTIALRGGRKVLAGRVEVLEVLETGEGPFAGKAMRVLFLAVDAESLGVWKRLRRLSTRTVQMWQLAPAPALESPGASGPPPPRPATGAMWRLDRLHRTQKLARVARPPSPGSEPEAAAADGAGEATPWLLLEDVERWIAEADRLRGEGRKTHAIANLVSSGEIDAPAPPAIITDRWLSDGVEVLVRCQIEVLPPETGTGRRPAEEIRSTAIVRSFERSLGGGSAARVATVITAASVAVTLAAVAYLVFL
jgi:eukaryotic-like serine/threonine-protein kinase